MNKVFLIGYLTRDPEYSETKSGIAVCKFGLAVNRSFTNANGERETDFFNITAWRALAENCSTYLSKGKRVCVVGNIQIGKYEDRNGIERQSVTVVAEDVEFLTPKSDDESETAPSKLTAKKKTLSELKPVEGDDLPF